METPLDLDSPIPFELTDIADGFLAGVRVADRVLGEAFQAAPDTPLRDAVIAVLDRTLGR